MAIELDPNNSAAFSNRGSTLSTLGNHQSAIADLDRSIELNPDNSATYYKRGIAYTGMGDHERVPFRTSTGSIELNPSSAIAFSNRGNIYDLLSRHEDAIRDYGRAIVLDPDDATIYYKQR